MEESGFEGERCAAYIWVQRFITGRIWAGVRSARVRLCAEEKVRT